MAYNMLVTLAKGSYDKLKKWRGEMKDWNEVFSSRQIDENNARETWQKTKAAGVRLVLQGESLYPDKLEEIPFSPFGLYFKGDICPLNKIRCLAIVGTRKATEEGLEIAKKIAKDLSGEGIGIVSGLALGVDREAHEGALESGGYTVAVLAGGLKEVYPRQHFHLAEKILTMGGCIMSEYPLWEEPYPPRFLERNRIVSGLGEGVVIIEAPERSGSLATARFALEQNRDVYVVPGSASQPNYRGSLGLLRDGARLIRSGEDLEEDLGLEKKEKESKKYNGLGKEEELVLKMIAMKRDGIILDSLLNLTKLDPQTLNETLTDLIIKEIIRDRQGKFYII